MKKLINIIVIALAITLIGCAAMKKQSKINDQMENFVFNTPANVLYSTAIDVMSSMYVPVKSTGKNEGASKWMIMDDTGLGMKKHQTKSRFTVKVSAMGKNKSTVRIYRESASNLTGSWGNVSTARFQNYEYNILKKIDPAKAAEIDAMASK